MHWASSGSTSVRAHKAVRRQAPPPSRPPHSWWAPQPPHALLRLQVLLPKGMTNALWLPGSRRTPTVHHLATRVGGPRPFNTSPSSMHRSLGLRNTAGQKDNCHHHRTSRAGHRLGAAASRLAQLTHLHCGYMSMHVPCTCHGMLETRGAALAQHLGSPADCCHRHPPNK
jgi:hypothetical protein